MVLYFCKRKEKRISAREVEKEREKETNEVGSLDVASRVNSDVERLDDFLLRSEEPEGEEDEIGREELFGSDL